MSKPGVQRGLVGAGGADRPGEPPGRGRRWEGRQASIPRRDFRGPRETGIGWRKEAGLGENKRSRRGKRQCGPPPSHPPAPWGRVPSAGDSFLWAPHTYCAASRASMVELAGFAACCSHHPYLYLGPAPWGGQGCRPGLHRAQPSSKIPSGRVRGGGWIAQPLGHVVERAGPGAIWIWGSPQLGWEWGAEPKGGWERSWIWGDPKKVEKPSVPEVSKRAGGSSEPRNRPGRGRRMTLSDRLRH